MNRRFFGKKASTTLCAIALPTTLSYAVYLPPNTKNTSLSETTKYRFTDYLGEITDYRFVNHDSNQGYLSYGIRFRDGRTECRRADRAFIDDLSSYGSVKLTYMADLFDHRGHTRDKIALVYPKSAYVTGHWSHVTPDSIDSTATKISSYLREKWGQS